MEIVIGNFPSYQDRCVYLDKPLTFYKRAQILVGDLWACFENKGPGEFPDIDRLTMFADYRVPQILLHLDMIQYTKEFYQRLQKDPHLDVQCQEEIEIRGCSIWAVELLRDYMVEMGAKNANSATVPSLWLIICRYSSLV